MESFYLLKFLKDNSYLNQERYDNLRFELDKHLHYYGEHFKYPHEAKENRNLFRQYAKYLFLIYTIIQNRFQKNLKNLILSNAYFSINEELKKIGYDVFYPFWQLSKNKKILGNVDVFARGERIKSKFKKDTFEELIKPDFLKEIDEFEGKLTSLFQTVRLKSLFTASDLGFFENLSIQICKKLGIPSFVFLHGLPARYNGIDDHRSDYLIVWGEKIKQAYINAGKDPNKILVSGHPSYRQIAHRQLTFSLENVVVTTKTLRGAHHSDGVVLGDRANSILYLYAVEKILRKHGVTSAKFRPHPSENEQWYLKFINTKFYKFDNANLKQSIQNASLVIGPTSTVFLESLYYGVNYLVFEPGLNNNDILNCKLVPPFDGSDKKIPVAKDEAELEYMLKNKIMVDSTCFNDYISTPFDISFVKKLI